MRDILEFAVLNSAKAAYAEHASTWKMLTVSWLELISSNACSRSAFTRNPLVYEALISMKYDQVMTTL